MKKYKSKLDQSSLTFLFTEFFSFYDDFHQKKKLKINISTNEPIISENKIYVFDMDDPFDQNHNPGDRPKPEYKQNIYKIRESFGKAYKFLK